VNRDDAIDELPPTYAVALRLHDAGASDYVVAVALGTEVESVPTILQLATRKLAALLGREVRS
jgi:DNA-directed RNA polymerase specialized sigma24 family protein